MLSLTIGHTAMPFIYCFYYIFVPCLYAYAGIKCLCAYFTSYALFGTHYLFCLCHFTYARCYHFWFSLLSLRYADVIDTTICSTQFQPGIAPSMTGPTLRMIAISAVRRYGLTLITARSFAPEWHDLPGSAWHYTASVRDTPQSTSIALLNTTNFFIMTFFLLFSFITHFATHHCRIDIYYKKTICWIMHTS